MLCKLSKAEKCRQRSRFLPNLLPSILLGVFLNMALMVWMPLADAQVPDSENADGRISGITLSQWDTRPVGQVAVGLKSHATGIFRSILTDIEGHFELRNLPPGTYDLVVEEAGYEPLRTKVQLDGSSPKLVLYLKSTNHLQALRKSSVVSVRELKIPGKARDEYQKGLRSLEKNDPGASLEHFTKAAHMFYGYYEAQYHIGLAKLRLGHKDEAMAAFQQAIDLSGGRYARAEFAIGALLSEEGSPNKAAAIIRRGLEVDDSLPQGHVLLGIVLMQQILADEAEKSAREALLRDANFAGAYLVLSDVHASRREFGAQLTDLETYLRLEPNGPESKRVLQARERALRNLEKSRLPD